MREREWTRLMKELRETRALFTERSDGDMEELIDIIERALRAIQEEQKAVAGLFDTILHDAEVQDARLRDLERRIGTAEEATAP